MEKNSKRHFFKAHFSFIFCLKKYVSGNKLNHFKIEKEKNLYDKWCFFFILNVSFFSN